MPIVLITGATAGIGQATALSFAKAGYDVIVTGRRADRLATLQKELALLGVRCLTLCFDVRDRSQTDKAIGSLSDDWKAINILVNNAGLGLGLSTLDKGDPDDWDTMIDTNIKGVLNVTHAVLPLMIPRKQGHIINIGSIAGKEVYKGGNIYNMTKFAIDALTKAMRIDFLDHSIRVTAIHPGMVDTDFNVVRFKGDRDAAAARYAGIHVLKPADIADAILYAATRPPHVTINEMTVMPTVQANTVYIQKEKN